MVYEVEEQVPVTNSQCCSSKYRCERCINDAEIRLGRRINKRPMLGAEGQPLFEPVLNHTFDLGVTNMYSPSFPAGGQLGLPESDWARGHVAHSRATIDRSSVVFNSVEDGPSGGPLGPPPTIIWNRQPESAKPCGCHVANNDTPNGPAGGQLGSPEIVW